MYVKIGLKKYTEIKNVSFAPETDVTGDSLPINYLSFDVKTTDTINVGAFVFFYDDLDNVWAKYWIKYADRKDARFVHVEAESMLVLLERVPMEPVIYTSDTAISTVISEIMTAILGNSWGNTISIHTDTAIASKTIKGYCPEQTARERLQWVCFAVGAYVNQTFTAYQDGEQYLVPSVTTFEIKELDTETVVDIPINKVFWKPTVRYKDYVTAVSVTKYAFSSGTPVQGDKYVTVNDVNYIMTESKVIVNNPSAPASAATNVIEVDDLYLINDDNADEVASHLGLIYFARNDIDADVIDNMEFLPSQKVSIPIDESNGAVGYIESADFKFGVQARASLKIIGSSLVDLGNLTIRYLYKGAIIGVRRYSFPVGTQYQIENQYVDKKSASHRYVYRPKNQYATGTIVAGANINEQDYDVALHFYINGGSEGEGYEVLSIKSVTDIEWDSTNKEIEIG